MKKLLIGLLTLTSALSYAQDGKKNSQVKAFENLRNSYGVELQENLAEFYHKNALENGRKYLLVKNNQSPGLSCATSANLNVSDDFDSSSDKKGVQIIPLSFDESGLQVVVTTCAAVSFVATESYDTPTLINAIKQSFDSMIISENEIISLPENVAGSRTLELPNGRAVKIDRLKLQEKN
jgi:hypothetical protein